MKIRTSIVTFSLTSLSVICIAAGQTNTPTPAPTVSSVPAAPTMSTPAAQVPPTNAMDNFRRNQERMQRMNAMRQLGGAPQLDAAAKAAAARRRAQEAGARPATMNPTQTSGDEAAAKQAAETKKAVTEASASPKPSESVAAEKPKN
jgi:hypothetical protein